MPDRTKDGYVGLYLKSGCQSRASRDEWTRIATAFDAGASMLTTTGIHGEQLIIRLGNVESIALHTAASLAALSEDERLEAEEKKASDLLSGGD